MALTDCDEDPDACDRNEHLPLDPREDLPADCQH
jgi:hypothetical protein